MEYQQSYTYKIFVYCMITMLVLPSLLAQPASAFSATPNPKDHPPVPPKERPELGLNNPYEPTTAVPLAGSSFFTNANGAFLYSPNHVSAENAPSNTSGWWQQQWQGLRLWWMNLTEEPAMQETETNEVVPTETAVFHLSDVQPTNSQVYGPPPIRLPELHQSINNIYDIYFPTILKAPFQSEIIIALTGGTFYVPGFGFLLQVPANYYSEVLRFVFTVSPKPTVDGAITTPYAFDLQAFTLSGTHITQFAQELTIVQSYDQAVLGGINPANLYLAYEVSQGEWVALPSVVNQAEGTVTAVTNHFTPFALLAGLPDCYDDIGIVASPTQPQGLQARMQAAWIPDYGCPDAYAYLVGTISGVGEYYSQIFSSGTPEGAIVDNPNAGWALFLPDSETHTVWSVYEPTANWLGGPLFNWLSAPQHYIDASHNFRAQEIWYFEYGFVSFNQDTNSWEAHQYFPRFPAGAFTWEIEASPSENPKYRLYFQGDFLPNPPADGVTADHPDVPSTALTMFIADMYSPTVPIESVPLFFNAGTIEGYSDYNYFYTDTVKVYLSGARADLTGYAPCNHYDPDPALQKYYLYLTPGIPNPAPFQYNCVGNGVSDTTPPEIEIIQVYGSDTDVNSPLLEATVLVRITDAFGIASQSINSTHGVMIQDLEPYTSSYYEYGFDVYSAVFAEIPQSTPITFTVEATDNSGLSNSDTATGQFEDGQALGSNSCMDPCDALFGYTNKKGNPVSTITGAKTETFPLFYLPGPGEADIQLALTYNSNSIRPSIFGMAMSSDLETKIVELYNPLVNGVEVVISDGGRFRFVDNGDGTFTAVSQGNEDTLIKDGDGYLYTTRTQVSYRFDENGRLLQKIFRDGNTITYTYTGDQLTSLTTGGRTVTLGYSVDGYVETISYADKVVTLVYDGDILTEIHDAMDGSWLLEYEIREIGEIVDERGEEYAYEAANYLLTRVTTPEGRIKNEQTYNDQMRVDTQISSSQGILGFSYVVHLDGSRETHMADAYGVEEIHYYNALGQLEQVTNREGDSEYYFYDAEFHLERKIDFNGFQWEYVRDDNGNIIELLGPEGLHEIWEYNDFNFPTYHQDGDGYEWHWEYDNHGNLTGIIQPLPDGATMTLVYNSQGLPTDIYDFSGNHIRHEYDLVTGDLLRTWDGEGALTQYVYDEYGRLLHKFMPEGGVWTFTYDLNDNLTAVAGPHDYHATFTYDKDSLLLHEVDADTYPTAYHYDKFGRLEEVRNGEDEPIWFRYGEMNELLEVENGRHATTFYTYDHNYRVTQIDMPEDVTWTFEYDALGNLLFFTDGEGRVTATTYDGLSRARALVQNYIEGGPINADTNVVTTFDYDYRRNVTSTVNALKGETEFGFDSVGFMEWSENEENERTTFDYDGNGNLTLIHYPEGNEIEMAYNGRNQLEFLWDGEGFMTEYHYDGNGNLTDVLAPDLIRLHHEYNQLDQRTFSTANFVEDGGIGSDLNVTTSYTYSKVGDLLSVTDAEGYFFEFEYDKAHRLTQEINPEGDIEYGYDEVGNLIRMVDANENPWNYTYDLRDRLTLATNPELHSVEYAYDHADNLTAVTDANGNMTTTDYDALNRPILFTAPAPLNYETHLAYNALGSLLSLTDGNDHTTYFEYDAAQRTTARIDAEGNRMEYEYDENGRLTLQRIPFPNPAQTIEEQFTYDGRNLLTSLTNGEGETTAYGYNSVGLLQTKTENDGIITHYSYDALRRLNRVTLNYLEGQPAIDDQNVSYHYLYDRVGNLVSIVDPLNHETVFAYNGLGSLVYERNPLDSEWFYDYDPAQNLTFRQDANGEITHYSYYADHQLHVIDYQDDSSVTYTYDPNNNPLTMQDGLGTTAWNYDEINRLTSVTDSLGRTIAYEYDAVNRRAITYPDTLTVVYTYFDNNWMETATDPVGGISTYAYDPAGRTTNVDHPNSTSSLRTYDRANRLTFLGNYQDGGDVLSEFSYLYDAAGQRVQATNTYGWRNPPTVVENYTYDGLRRLTAVTDDDGLAMSYEYDRAGNRTLWQTNDDPFGQSPQDGFTATYSYNAANQLTTAQIERTPPAQSETVTYSYDANGNRIDRLVAGNGSDAGVAYTYDDENRLVSVYNYLATGGGNINWQDETTMAYDGNGRRLVETYDPHAGGGGLKRTEYTFDGLDPIAEYDLWNNHQRNYYRGAGNELIQLHHFPAGSQGQQYWYHHNGHGDIAGLTKHDGQSTHNYRYDAYGGVTPDNGNWTSPHNDYTLTEKAYDDHTGLHYFGARHYDSRTAVWLTQDTNRGELFAPLSLHRFNYVLNNPINLIDFNGFQAQPVECQQDGWDDDQGLFTPENCVNLESGDLDFTEQWYRDLASRLRSDGLLQGATHFEHFLDGSGKELKLDSTWVKNNVIDAIPDVNKSLNKLEKWYIRSIADIYSNHCFAPGTYADLVITPQYWKFPFGAGGNQRDVASAMGSFRMDAKVQVLSLEKRSFGRVEAKIKVNITIFDVYNWNPGQGVSYPPSLNGNQIPDDWAFSLVQNGRAANFVIRGDYSYEETMTVWASKPSSDLPGDWVPTSCTGSQFDIDAEGPGTMDYCGNQMR